MMVNPAAACVQVLQMQQMQQMQMQVQQMCYPRMEPHPPPLAAASGRDQISSSESNSEDDDLEVEPVHATVLKLQTKAASEMRFREGVPAKIPTAKVASEQGAKKRETEKNIVVSEKVAEKETEKDQVAATKVVKKEPSVAMQVVSKERPTAKVVAKVPLAAADVAANVGGTTSHPGSLAMVCTVPSSRKRRLIAGGRDPTLRYVEISTMGWKTEGCGYTQNKKALYENLRARVEFRGVPRADILIDCRPLKRYDLPGYILSHTGYHNMIMMQAIDHSYFVPTLTDVVQTVMALMDSGQVAVHVWAMCTGGNHRSVAFSLVLESILSRMQYHVRIRHFSKSSWESRGLCMGCDQCQKVTSALGL